MNNSEIIALSKAVADKAAKGASSDLETGSHEVDFLVRIHGTFNKADGHPAKLVQKAKPWGLLAVALSKLNGVTVESLIKEFFEADEAKTKDIEARAKVAIEKIKGSTGGWVNGSVTSVKLTVEELSMADAGDIESSEVA